METTSLSFGQPLWLWTLVLPPMLAILFFVAHRRSRKLVEKLVAPRLRSFLAGSVSPARRFLRSALVLTALSFLILALAQPRSGWRDLELKSSGRDVILAIDVSRSMLATDIPPNRLERARLFSRDLLGFLRGDRVGIVAFAGSAFLQAPLTLDQTALEATLDELSPDIIPLGGTNIAEAIRVSLAAFGSAEGKSRAIVIVSDGEELDADGIASAKEAAAQGVTIFTVGIGSAEGSLIPIIDERGQSDFVRDPSGKPVLSKIDAVRLEEIAKVTNGFYIPIGTDAAAQIFNAGIETLERSEASNLVTRQPIEIYQIPLSIAIATMVLWLLVGDKKWSGRRKNSAGSAILYACALFLHPTHSTEASPADALKKYKEGDYAAALDQFQQGAREGHQPYKQLFNAGAAAYRAGNFAAAIDFFTQALLDSDPDLQEKANYNLGNALVRKGETTNDKKAKKKDFENALEYYEEALRLNPKNKKASENIEVVKKLIEELEKEQEKQEQQKQDQQNQDQQNQDQQNQDQQNQDQQNQDQQNQDQQKQDGAKPQPTLDVNAPPEPKKEGELKSADDAAQEDSEPQPQAFEPEEKEGEMSEAQARALLDALRGEEQRVQLLRRQRQRRTLKDW
jgi:Ca-activated chloride channel family protein